MPSRHQTFQLPEPAELPGEDELPYDFGPNLESSLHREAMADLIESLNHHLQSQGDRSTYVAGNMALYFQASQIENNSFLGPDLMVIKGVSSLRPRKSWVVWKEGRAPNVVIELLSASTESIDRNHKMSIYAQALRVQEYILLDPVDGRLEAYRLDPHGNLYVVLPPDEEGAVECAQLGLRLGLRWEDWGEAEVPRPRWQLPDGTWLLTAQERAEQQRLRAEQERQKAEQERQRAEAAEARLAELMEKLRAAGLV